MITKLTHIDEKEWDSFVQHNECSYYFKIAWRDIIFQNFKHKYVYYIHKNDQNQIDGILPLFIIKSFLGTKIISIPYCPYGGAVSKNKKVRELLVETAIDLYKSLDAKFIELKEMSIAYPNFIESSNYFTFQLDLSREIENIWTDLSKSTKRKIKKGQKYKTQVTIDSDIKVFYDLYLKHLIKIGTPAINFNFFKELIKRDIDNVKVASIWYNDKIVASILLLETTAGVVYDRGATEYSMRHLNLNYILFWEVIKYYSSLGIKFFDFGRSVQQSGTFQFKNSWRPNIIKLKYQYYMLSGTPSDLSQTGWKRKMFTKIFKILPRMAYIDNYLRKIYP